MKTYLLLLLALFLVMSINAQTIYDFNSENNNEWIVVDDVVMGGRSNGNFKIDNGNGVFEGEVSLENNGGFSSIRYNPQTINTGGFTKVLIRLKGDGKDYQFRLKAKRENYYSYITTFSTVEGEWQTISLNLSDMYPSFRGRRLDAPNYNGNTIEEVSILIANKKAEDFKLLLDKIWLE